MAKYVDVEKVFCADCEDKDKCGSPDVFCDVHSMPTADVVPVVHGKWIIPTKIGHRSFNIPHCSACDGVPCGVDENTKFCPNCGADMREVDDAAD